MKIHKDQKGGAGVLAVIGVTLLFVVVLPLLGAALGIINLPFLKLSKQVELNQGVINKTYDTDYCLNNYEWFKDTYQDIQQSDTKIANVQQQLDNFTTTAGTRDKWTFEDKTLYNNLTTELTGIRNYKADLTGQYNSRTTQLNRVACKELPLFVKP